MKRPQKNRLKIEQLENRSLMAVDFSLLVETNSSQSLTPTEPNVLGAVADAVIFSASRGELAGLILSSPNDPTAPTAQLADSSSYLLNDRSNQFNINGRIVFNRLSDTPTASGLWSTDGTAAGSMRIGPAATGNVAVINGLAYYYVHQSEGRQIWVTDGTAAGTRHLISDRDSQNYHFRSPLTAFDGQPYLTVQSSDSVEHLATIDTATNRIVPVAVLPPGATAQLVPLNERLLFTRGFANQSLLYSYTKTKGIELLSDQLSGTQFKPAIQIVGSRAYFIAGDRQLWSTDGTPSGTTRFLNDDYIFPGQPIIASMGDRIVFAGYGGNGQQYFVSDGTVAGTTNLGINYPLLATSLPIVTTTDAFYFVGRGQGAAYHLYQLPATGSSPQAVAPVAPPRDAEPYFQFQLFTNLPTVINGRVFYSDRVNGNTILKEYLPNQGTSRIHSQSHGTAGSELREIAHDHQYAWFQIGNQLWQTNGTSARTIPAQFLNDTPTITNAQVINGSLVFEGVTGVFPAETELARWSIDPMTATATKLATLTGSALSPITSLSSMRLQLRLQDILHSGVYSISEDLRTQQLVAEIPPQPNTTAIKPVALGDRILFVVDSQLWQSDGTAAGTLRLKTLSDSENVLDELRLNENGEVVFITDTKQIYKLVIGQTQPIHIGTIATPPNTTFASDFLPLRNGIVFLGGNTTERINLWYTDGTANGTQLLQDFGRRNGGEIRYMLGVTHGKAIVATGNGLRGYSLWSTDGTVEGTSQLFHSTIGFQVTGNEAPWVALTPDGDLLFQFFEPTSGREIWITDGTTIGTQLFADINPGEASSDPRFVSVGSKVIAFATTAEFGKQEPFVADLNQFDWSTSSSFLFFVQETIPGALLGTIKLSDVSPNDIVEFRFKDVSFANTFSINSNTGQLRLAPGVALDFEQQQNLTFKVDARYIDPVSLQEVMRELTIQVQVVNEIEGPRIDDQVFEVDENLGSFQFVGKLELTKEDNSRIFFNRKDGRPFFIETTSGHILVSVPSLMDFEKYPTLSFSVQVYDSTTDQGDTANITIRLKDVNERPQLVQSASPVTVFSGAELAKPIDAVFSDPEGNTLSYALSQLDGGPLPGWLSFDANEKKVIASPAKQNIGKHTYLLTAMDPAGNKQSTPVKVNVLDGEFQWHNVLRPMDVNGDGILSPVDVLLIISQINQSRQLPAQNAAALFFYDTNRDNQCTPVDALLVISRLFSPSGSGEGEEAPANANDLYFASHYDSEVGQENPGQFLRNRRAQFGKIIVPSVR